jgi:hypothetical protein
MICWGNGNYLRHQGPSWIALLHRWALLCKRDAYSITKSSKKYKGQGLYCKTYICHFIFGIYSLKHGVPRPFFSCLHQSHVSRWFCVVLPENMGTKQIWMIPGTIVVLIWVRVILNVWKWLYYARILQTYNLRQILSNIRELFQESRFMKTFTWHADLRQFMV